MPLLLTENDVRAVISMPELIASMEDTLASFSAQQVVQPVRTILDIAEHHAFFGVMPAYLSGVPALGAKLVTVYHSNLARGLASHLATIVLLDPETGELLAIVDGRFITEARTAAASAVSAKKLARADASRLAILGSGVQARSHLEALRHVRNIGEVRAWSPSRDHLDAFAGETGAIPADSAEAAVRGADIVVLATSSPVPVVESDWVSDGAHVISVGACRPTQCEIGPALVARGRLFVDSRASALKESGDVVMGIAGGFFEEGHIVAELGESAARRTSPEEITIFKSLGLAVEDIVAAHLALRRAKELGKGTGI